MIEKTFLLCNPTGFSYKIIYVPYIALMEAGIAQWYSAGLRAG
jgi:hypothetical protein